MIKQIWMVTSSHIAVFQNMIQLTTTKLDVLYEQKQQQIQFVTGKSNNHIGQVAKKAIRFPNVEMQTEGSLYSLIVNSNKKQKQQQQQQPYVPQLS